MDKDVERNLTSMEVKIVLSKICGHFNCPPDNCALNELTRYFVQLGEERGFDPKEEAENFAAGLLDPGDNKALRVARMLFIYQATASKFSGPILS